MNKPVVLITGALTGIGRAAAVAFAKRGANVVVSGRRDETGEALAEELRTLGSEAEFITPTCATKTMSERSSIRPSPGSAASMSP